MQATDSERFKSLSLNFNLVMLFISPQSQPSFVIVVVAAADDDGLEGGSRRAGDFSTDQVSIERASEGEETLANLELV